MGIKVLHLIDSGGLYGAEAMLLDLVAEQCKAGLQPLILSAGTPDIVEKPLEAEARRRGLPVMPYRMKAGLNFRKGLAVLRYAKIEGFDVLHSHGYKFNILLGGLPRRIRNIPLLTTVHGYVHAARFSKEWMNHKLDQYCLKRMDAVVFVSAVTQAQFRLIAGKSFVINNGIDLSERPASKKDAGVRGELEEFLAAHGPVIGSIGRLAREKGYGDLINAFQRLSHDIADSGLVICGEGYMRGELEQLVEEAGLKDRILLAGYHSGVEDILNRIDILVIASTTEGLPIILLEALKMKVPVVATEVGAIPEVLDKGRCGLLVNPGDVDALHAAMLSACRHRLDGTKMAIRGFDRLKAFYTSSVMSHEYSKLYSGLVRDS